MAQSNIVKGADVKIFISGNQYKEAQSITWTVDCGDSEIFGIDSQFAQEIAPTRVTVQGSVSGVLLKLSGGLQGHEIRTKINEVLHGAYTSLRVKDRSVDRDLLWLPQMKVTSETYQITSKSTVRVSFNFKGIIPYFPLDMD